MVKLASTASLFLLTILNLVLNSFVDCKTLSKESFSQLAGSDNNLLIKFYAPWCPHCVKLEPTWNTLMSAVNKELKFKTIVARVDCTEEGDLCTAENIQGYPTLKLYQAGSKAGTEYEGPRELNQLVEFLRKQLDIDLPDLVDSEEEKTPLAEPSLAADGDFDTEDITVLEDIDLPEAINGLVELTDENLDSFISKGRHFVKFYAPWCGHCQRLAPTWDQLADSFKHDQSVSISKIDCDQYRGACKPYGVKGYPTLLWIVDGKVMEKYQGPRTHEELKKYVVERVEEEKQSSDVVRSEDLVVYLTERNFDKTIKKGITFIMFMAPWCTHCRRLAPVWDELGKKIAGTDGVRVAKVDCGSFEKFCDEHGINGYPTLILFKDGKRIREYEDERTLEQLFDFLAIQVPALTQASKPVDSTKKDEL